MEFAIGHHSSDGTRSVAGKLHSVGLDDVALAVTVVEVAVLVGSVETAVATVATGLRGHAGGEVGLLAVLVPIAIAANGPLGTVDAVAALGLDGGLLTILVPVAVGADGPLGTIAAVRAVLAQGVVLGLHTVLVPETVHADGPHLGVGSIGDGVLLSVAERDHQAVAHLVHTRNHTAIGDQALDLVQRFLVGVELLLQACDVIIIVLAGREHTRGANKEQRHEQSTNEFLTHSS